jgi:hypothetical protein
MDPMMDDFDARAVADDRNCVAHPNVDLSGGLEHPVRQIAGRDRPQVRRLGERDARWWDELKVIRVQRVSDSHVTDHQGA